MTGLFCGKLGLFGYVAARLQFQQGNWGYSFLRRFGGNIAYFAEM